MRLPKDFRRGHSDELACKHRDVTCCPACAAKHPEIIEVYGQHFWIDNAMDRHYLRQMMESKCRQ